ncbi:MAG TPA: translation initiation factor IF-2 associated domain-containing protein, partial [Rudaea sp.]|nr:translation initiation factor IF-2 associated domain-containing protein [Rudaea sp.]
MSDVTIKQLAGVLGLSVDKLLVQLDGAGMKFSGPDQIITSAEKLKLHGFLRRAHGKDDKPADEGSAPRQITLKRKSVSELTVNQGAARGKTVAVEVRQKRTYVKRSAVAESQEVDLEREDALKKLQESQARNQAEQAALKAQDKRRAEEEAKLRAAEEARRADEARQRAEVEAKTGEPAAPAEKPAKEERAAAAPR